VGHTLKKVRHMNGGSPVRARLDGGGRRIRTFGSWSRDRQPDRGRRDCLLENGSGSVGEPEVRTHLPPAKSQERTLPYCERCCGTGPTRSTTRSADPGRRGLGDRGESNVVPYVLGVRSYHGRARQTANHPLDASHIAFRSAEQRDRGFADSPLEEGGFEPSVPLSEDEVSERVNGSA
jgi:hypothetical protein